MMISVILPVYNVGDYIEECLDSLLNQSIGESNIEVVLVDDCSTDNSEDKILQYKNKFTNFQYYRLTTNQGSPGKPRNIGVNLSNGEFIHFMDPDDIMDVYAYETLMKTISPEDDFVMGKMLSFNEDGSTFQHISFREYKMNKTYMHTSLGETPFFVQVKVGVVLKLIRKSFYQQNNIKFVENMRNGEDKLVDTILYTKASSFSYVPFNIYYYRNRDSGDNKSLTHQDILDSLYNDIKAYYICYKYYNDEELQFFRINVLRSLFWKILDTEFDKLIYREKVKIIDAIHEIIKNYNPTIVEMYLSNEMPIIKMIANKDYYLAISYAALLEARRRYFYKGLELKGKVAEVNKFKQSKSFKLYKIVLFLKNITRREK
ncbi:glycosyltransferase family 2 protein [Staphylococcus equorum]|uniref:glycosyltransferase family 2 protein n=1 Tax=Staphylococcus equorum TaxID=246432 RepID=UPI002556A6EF|nr:glycosyltransferase family 2 protein [Staphylococcus equorum]MDK9869776.1 glycosyltransferase family 2 protein [Staphylococcus equorum]